jgi:hypothetical protein
VFISLRNGEVQKNFFFIMFYVAAVEDTMLYRALITKWEGEIQEVKKVRVPFADYCSSLILDVFNQNFLFVWQSNLIMREAREIREHEASVCKDLNKTLYKLYGS